MEENINKMIEESELEKFRKKNKMKDNKQKNKKKDKKLQSKKNKIEKLQGRDKVTNIKKRVNLKNTKKQNEEQEKIYNNKTNRLEITKQKRYQKNFSKQAEKEKKTENENKNNNNSKKKKKIIFFQDNRKKVIDTTEWPYSPIGFLRIKINNINYDATGIMIFPMIVLTAAHNIFDLDTGKYATDILFIPGKDGNEAKFGSYKVLEYFFPEEYKQNDIEDYAVLLIEKKKEEKNCIGVSTGFFGLKIIENIKQIENGILSLFGYPGDKREGENNNYNEMWGMEMKIDKKNVKIINKLAKYKHFTFGGMSGSGLVLKKDNILKVIGVHVRTNLNWKECTKISGEIYGKIRNWVTKILLNKSKFNDMFKNEIERYIERVVEGKGIEFV